ncbi:PDZ domain-containing protein [Lacticaseibacillus kribbianus]|uniref:PDZ domain-containing protein n=1 Tax=Lacticaseibacillus kribbianus TaxID=2926292 RepID=UPI001CD638A7|nr:PDZ domain-containing protein [Lacticaseibacillus kribbianus]
MRILISMVGPVTLVGLAVALFWRWWRVRHERAVFLTAIDRHWTNWWAGLIGGVALGVVVSGVAVLLGLMLPPAATLALSGLCVLALLLSWAGFGAWGLGLAGLVVVLATRYLDWPPLEAPGVAWAWRLAGLVGLLWLGNGALVRWLNPPIDVPSVAASRRGARVATYTRRQFYWVPLVLPVPGAWLAALPYWPQLSISDQHFALIGLPLVLGLALTTRKQLPKTALKPIGRAYLIAGALALVLGVVGNLRPAFGLWVLGGLAVLGLALAVATRVAARAGAAFVSETGSGVRLVAVLPDTPAAKMGLEAGDIVLLANQVPVSTQAALYAALQAHPTYCRLKVQRLDGRIKLAETAIYAGAPHELGMVTFDPNETPDVD